MLTETSKGTPWSPIAGEPLWRVPEAEAENCAWGWEQVPRTNDREGKGESKPQNSENLLPVPPSNPGTCSCPFHLPPPQGSLTPAASSPLPGLGPGPEAAADLDGLSVVDFYHVEVKTVDPFARGDESAAF